MLSKNIIPRCHFIQYHAFFVFLLFSGSSMALTAECHSFYKVEPISGEIIEVLSDNSLKPLGQRQIVSFPIEAIQSRDMEFAGNLSHFPLEHHRNIDTYLHSMLGTTSNRKTFHRSRHLLGEVLNSDVFYDTLVQTLSAPPFNVKNATDVRVYFENILLLAKSRRGKESGKVSEFELLTRKIAEALKVKINRMLNEASGVNIGTVLKDLKLLPEELHLFEENWARLQELENGNNDAGLLEAVAINLVEARSQLAAKVIEHLDASSKSKSYALAVVDSQPSFLARLRGLVSRAKEGTNSLVLIDKNRENIEEPRPSRIHSAQEMTPDVVTAHIKRVRNNLFSALTVYHTDWSTRPITFYTIVFHLRELIKFNHSQIKNAFNDKELANLNSSILNFISEYSSGSQYQTTRAEHPVLSSFSSEIVHLFNDGIKEFNLKNPSQALPLLRSSDIYEAKESLGAYVGVPKRGLVKMSQIEVLFLSWMHIFPSTPLAGNDVAPALKKIYDRILALKPLDQAENVDALEYYKWLIHRMVNTGTPL